MKKLIIIAFVFGSCLSVFSQEYKELKTQEDKLDHIYNNILGKQISDYLELKIEYGKLETKYQDLQSESSDNASKMTDLEKKCAISESEKLKLQKADTLKSKKISRLLATKKELEAQINTEKNRVKKEISLILKNEGIISEDLLLITKKRALAYGINTTTDLDKYIDANQDIIEAHNLLSKRFDDSKVKARLTILNKIKNNRFVWQQKKVQSLIVLLATYCENSNELFNFFGFVDDYGKADGPLINKLESKRKNLTSYPFLLEELNKKIKNTNYKSSIEECDD